MINAIVNELDFLDSTLDGTPHDSVAPAAYTRPSTEEGTVFEVA